MRLSLLARADLPGKVEKMRGFESACMNGVVSACFLCGFRGVAARATKFWGENRKVSLELLLRELLLIRATCMCFSHINVFFFFCSDSIAGNALIELS